MVTFGYYFASRKMGNDNIVRIAILVFVPRFCDNIIGIALFVFVLQFYWTLHNQTLNNESLILVTDLDFRN